MYHYVCDVCIYAYVDLILTDFRDHVMFFEYSSKLFHDAGENRVQCRNKSATLNFLTVIYMSTFFEI